MFADRGPTDVVFYTAGELIKHTVIEGDELTLRSREGEDVLVRNVRILGPDRYSGTIYGFEPSHATEHAGMELEQQVEFHESNIFAVRRA
jgi:hypothetical protein